MIRGLIDRIASEVRLGHRTWLAQNRFLVILMLAAALMWPLPSFAILVGGFLSKNTFGSREWLYSLAPAALLLSAPVAFGYSQTGSLGLPTAFHLLPLQPNTVEQVAWNGMWGMLSGISLMMLVGYLGGLAWSTKDQRRSWLLGAVCVFLMLANGNIYGRTITNITANQVYVETWSEAGTVFGDQWREQRKIEGQDPDLSYSKARMQTLIHQIRQVDPKTADLMADAVNKSSAKP